MKEKIVGLLTLILLVGVTLSFLLQGQGLESIQQFISKKNSVTIEQSEDVEPNDVQILSQEVSVIVDREALTDILGAIRIDYSDKNLVEQGFVFEQLTNGHQCGCGESFTPVRDLKNG